LWIESEDEKTQVIFRVDNNNLEVDFGESGKAFVRQFYDIDIQKLSAIVQKAIIMEWLSITGNFEPIYLPAARTGFVLSKDVINKVSRQETFGIVKNMFSPFTAPIIEFLNELEKLSIENSSRYKEIVEWIETYMVNGNILYEETGKKEIRYIPKGRDNSISLRTSSAVVTELTPLLLMLKYGQRASEIFYEEPETCLHPQLQLYMGRLLVRMVNSGINIMATTHSDIIIQHINNMCKLYELGTPCELLEELGLNKIDSIDKNNIAIYQFCDLGASSKVKRIRYTEGGFAIPSFQETLLNVLGQTSRIQDYEK
jgi:hypothetical protein